MSAACCAGRPRILIFHFPLIFEITTLRAADSSAAIAGSAFAAGKKSVPPSGGLYIDIFKKMEDKKCEKTLFCSAVIVCHDFQFVANKRTGGKLAT